MPGPPRVALVGVSGYGRVYRRHLEAAAARGEIQLAAAVVINPEEEPETCQRLLRQGVEIHASWEGMLAAWRGRLDLCAIPVPIHLHEKVAVAALEAGANVLLEKPLAATVSQARAIRQAEGRTGRWVAVGYQDFYAPTTMGIFSRLADGHLGKVRSIRWLGLWPRTEAYYRRNEWAGRLSLRGEAVRDSPLHNAMAHFLNLSFYWAGADLGRFAFPAGIEAELYRGFAIESFDTAVMRLTTDNGVTIGVAATHCCPDPQPIRIEVEGEDGLLTWIHREGVIWNRGGKTERWGMEAEDEVVAAMFSAVRRRLEEPGGRICTTEDAFSQLACVEAIHEKFPIHTVPVAGGRWREFGSEPIFSRDIEQEFRRCLAEKALPTERKLSWAIRAHRREVGREIGPSAGRVGIV